jgi:hypothetical protein
MLTPHEIISRIDAHTVESEAEPPRKYLGASQIGEKCVRRLWYDFRWCGGEKFDGRMLRLFQRGDREEARFKELLESAGFVVMVPTPETEDDFKFKDCEGHLAGTCDGVISESESPEHDEYAHALGATEWYLGEFKSLNSKGFNELKKKGVRETYPKYFSQMQTYMGELKLPYCLFCAVNKDDDDLYFEWVPFDQSHFEVCLNKAELVINSETPPPKYSNDPNSFTCRYCPHTLTCHANIPLAQNLQNCRNCIHGHPATEGSWVCGAGKDFGTRCDRYQFAG